ncbi:hypothetical protein LTR99_010402 [Exophiala xenobiotica]|uniref:AB hydrolase-1 domain-containing protein n=1 Tax=Vermiconidia calcicola TaxID=1690605 RepID=A0AAV9Q4Q2_9PEZI|nr:hypothetical protein LTR72_007751 [Exophiala xenobiotica]KAK5530265.1 hypothetical protein LTR23_010423 [Chaetothyriales sp. CCFEE 6169]KAK5534119.1 hypothetical protein LTR25_007099 [Vermiconidia calcicola]KAK5226484.1 hypothetical protein LTR47_008941 [Exophiala xenobiotica]KAK5244215.1 hypothetical protein LTS06_010168 [Exophiala xenobiotica]
MAEENKSLAWITFPPCPGLPPASTAEVQGIIRLPHNVELWHGIYGVPLKVSLKAGKPPLAFIHGGVSHSGYYGHQIKYFAPNHTIIVYDLRGHGRSPFGDDKQLTYDKLSDDLLALLDHYSIPKVALIAWSEGCVVSWSFLSRFPKRVERAWLYSAVDDYRKTDGERVSQIPMVKEYFGRMETEWQELNPGKNYGEFIGCYVNLWMREPLWNAETFRNVPIRGEHTDAPIVWVVTADYDDWIPPETHRRFQSYIKNSSFLEMPGTGHMAFVQTPEIYNRLVDAFLHDPKPDMSKPQLKASL